MTLWTFEWLLFAFNIWTLTRLVPQPPSRVRTGLVVFAGVTALGCLAVIAAL